MRVRAVMPGGRRSAGPVASRLAMGSLVLALGVSVATCRLDKLINPATADRLVVSPTSVDTSAHFGSIGTDTVVLRVRSADGGALSWTATKSAVWLALLDSTGTTPDSVRVEIDPDTLSQTLHQDTIVFVSTRTGAVLKVPLTLDMLPEAAELMVTPAAAAETAFVGSAAPDTFFLRIDNVGAVPLTWGAAADSAWITLAKDSGGAPPADSTAVVLTPGVLPQGSRTGRITVTAPVAEDPVTTVPVTFVILPCDEPLITLDTVVTGSIALSDCVAPQRAGRQAKLYALQANAGDTLSFRLTSTAFTPYLILTNSTGVAVLDSIDRCAAVDTACLTDFIVSNTGRYVIEVTTANPGETGAFTLSAVKERTPSLAAVGQFRADSTTAILVGAATPQSAVVFKATLNDPNPQDSVRLQVELADVTSGTQVDSSAVVPRGTAVALRVSGLTENHAYYWRARACDKSGRCSAWFNFGGNADPAADFFVNAVEEDPALPAGADQFQANGVTLIPVGGSASTVVFKGLVTDPDPLDLISLDVEFKTTDVSFNGVGTRGTGVLTDNTAQLTASPERGLAGLNYYWRARACDQTNRCSAWFSFGGNNDVSGGILNPAATDFRVP